MKRGKKWKATLTGWANGASFPPRPKATLLYWTNLTGTEERAKELPLTSSCAVAIG